MSHQPYARRKCEAVTNRVEPSDKVARTVRFARQPRGKRVSASTEAEWELGSKGMANPGELLINAVRPNKPKVLSGLSQQATWRVLGLNPPQSWAPNATGGKREPNPFIGSIERNTVSPSSSRTGQRGRKACLRGGG